MRKKTIEPIPKLVRLWTHLTPAMRTRLTKLMHSTPGTMRQYVEGRREVSPELAVRFEKAANTLNIEPINRTQLNKTCHACEYARACLTRPRGLHVPKLKVEVPE